MLDEMHKFIDNYHIVRWGIGLLITIIVLTLFFKDVVGRWRFKQDKSQSNKPKKSIDRYRLENTDD